MRNFKKFLALVLAMLMVVSAGAAVSAFDDVADDSTYAAAIADLAEKEIVRGKTADAFDPDANVTRWQMALFIVRAITGETDDANWADGFCYFNDIAAGQYPGAISKAAAAGIILGRTENEFDPTANVNYAEALTMAVRALGYEERDKDGKITFSYPNDYLAKAIDLGLTKGVKVADKYQALTRAETAQIIFNMIYAERNNKDLTFAEEFFGEIGVSNANTYVLVATPKQAIEGFDTVDADLGVVVLAKLDKLGNYDGEMYVKAEDLGITLDEAEKHIGATVVLVNFNEKTGTFARSIIRDTETATNANVTVKASGKITIKGRTYYVVDEYTDTKIRNEIMLYNGDGLTQITDANKLTGNYQLTLADDDQDGVYDRAIVDTIYLSVFNKFDGEKDKTVGAWDADAKNTYSEELALGDVFTYTYNKALKFVNVLGTLDLMEGKLEAINTTEVAKDGSWAVKLTIDGNVYVLANANREAKGLTGANLKSGEFKNFANIAGKNSDTDGGAYTPAIAYTADYLGLTLGGNVRFYANGTEIVAVANTFTAEAVKNLGVIKAITSYDTTGVYADIYMGGKLVKDAKIVKFLDVDFAKLNQFTLSLKLSEVYNKAKEGTVVTYVENTDGTYTVTAIRKAEKIGEDVNDDYIVANYGLNPISSLNGRSFKDGIADRYADGTDFTENNALNNKYVLRANDNTVFYFISGNSVKVFVGVPEDGSKIAGSAKANIFADKIGYAVDKNAIAGVASVVIVNYTSENDVTGFGGVVKANEAKTSTVFVATTGTVSKVLGSTIGLTGTDANANFYAYTADKLGLDMTTGNVVKTVYVRPDYVETFETALKTDGKDFFKVDANGIVVSVTTVDNDVFATGNLTNIVDARNISVTVGTKTFTGLKSVITVKDSDLATSKPGYEWIEDLKQNVYAYQNDKTLIVLINVPATPTTPDTTDGKATAKWFWGSADHSTANGPFAAVYEAGEATGTGKVTLYNADYTGIGGQFNNATLSTSQSASGAINVEITKRNANGVYEKVTGIKANATFKDAVLTVTSIVDNTVGLPFTLEAGTYNVVATFVDNTGAGVQVEYAFVK